MVKNRVAPPKSLFHVVTWIEKDRYTLIKQSVHQVCQQLPFTISPVTAVNDVCIQLRDVYV